MITLRFMGDWSPFYGVPLAALLAGAAWWLYRREVRARGGWPAWLLPLLRAVAVALLTLMLTGPVLHHRQTVGHAGRVLIALDASQSLTVHDAALSPGRKLLVAANLGLPPREIRDQINYLQAAQRALLDASISLGPRTSSSATTPRELKAAAASVIRAMQTAQDHLDGAVKEEFRREMLDPAFALEHAPADALGEQLSALSEKIDPWRVRLRQMAEDQAAATMRLSAPALAEALKQFDAMTRWQRLQALLLSGNGSLLGALARGHQVEVVALEGDGIQPLWSGGPLRPNASGVLPPAFKGEPLSPYTDLSPAFKAALSRHAADSTSTTQASPDHEPLALIMLTDGRHNSGESPLLAARACGERGIPVFTIGLGPDKPVPDLAVVRVEAPQAIYYKDHLKGRVILKDDMPPGRPFKLRIQCGERVLWEQLTQSTGEHQRPIDFDLSVEDLLKEKASHDPKDQTLRSASLDLRVAVSGLEKEDAEPRNDALGFPVRATFQRNRILILDGRPRWEFRYLRDLFERDTRWDVTTIVADPTEPNGGIRRGPDPHDFPATREALFSYDLIFLGDFPAENLRPEELGWLCDFVGQRGGGLILIDGERANLRRYGSTPLADLVPVTWTGAAPMENTTALRLTEKGRLRLTRRGLDLAALTLASGQTENAAIWDSLLPPHWLAPVTPLPGAEVLLEAIVESNNIPALVSRRYGAGKVLYAAFDESWRFRYRVADLHHARYWSQVAGWIMAPEYAASNRFVSLDAGALVYNPGSAVELRGRVRDAQGRTVMGAKVTAHLSCDGKDVTSLPLAPDEDGGEYRGNPGALEPGHYEMRLEVPGLSADQLSPRTDFFIRAPEGGELTELTCDEALLKQLAVATSGEYFREENARDITARIQTFLEPRVIESETVLWQSYWWFGALALLFTVEWILRKRVGML